MDIRIDETDNRYSKLLVKKYAYTKNRKAYWLCDCDCGKVIIVQGCHLRNKHTQSCGCLKHSEEHCRKISEIRKGKHHSKETRKRMSEDRKGRCISEEGKNNIRKAKLGDKNPSWKGGITPQLALDRNILVDSGWNKRILQRDNFTCRMCGSYGGKLQSHHIYRFSLYEGYRDKEWNGITLCRVCHKLVKGKEHLFIDHFSNLVK